MRNSVGGMGTVLVLGGTSDIGRGIAAGLADRGVETVVLAGRDVDALRAAGEGLGAGRVDVLPFDATDTASHQSLFDRVVTEHGDIDVAVVAFGVLPIQEEVESDVAAAVAVAEVNYVGALSCCLIAAQLLRRQGHGTLVVLSSIAGQRARRSNFVYGSTKAGLDALAEGIGHMLEGTGADVVIVRPGFVRTKMTAGVDESPMATTVDEVATATIAAIAAGRRVVWVPGRLRLVAAVLRNLPTRVMARIRR